MGLKQPLYALLIAPDEKARRAIVTEEKAITIREGHRDYRADRPVMLCCHLKPWAVMADITEVRHTTLAEVTPAECRDDGYESTNEMLADLRRFYPELSMGSAVTVIRWNNVRGFLPDNRDNLVFFE